jgi:Domain of unknown function (DUF4962)
MSRDLEMLHGTERVPVTWEDDHAFSFTRHLQPGIYTVGVYADLADFDWDSLYQPMTKHGNTGQITGPWDFHLYNGFQPLIPTWRVEIDGREVGLFYFPRPTLRDMDTKTGRGEFAFEVAEAHDVSIVCRPHMDFALKPLALTLETSAFDRFVDQPWAAKGLDANWAWAMGQGANMSATAERIRGTGMECLLSEGVTYFRDRDMSTSALKALGEEALPIFALGWRLLGDEDCLDRTKEMIRALLELPAWGNQKKYGYAHNGDMHAGMILYCLALVYNWLQDDLGDGLKSALLERLERQGDIFLEQQLLHVHYWGGAVAQDHGFRSTSMFLFGALALLGHTERAAHWLRFLVPRFERTLAVLPDDGCAPFTTYQQLFNTYHNTADVAIALKYASGRDVLTLPALRNAPDYVLASLDEESMTCARGPFLYEYSFFLALAGGRDASRARYLVKLLEEAYHKRNYHFRPEEAFRHDRVYNNLKTCLFLYDATLASEARPETPALTHFPDGGAVYYQSPNSRLQVSARCFPMTASFHATGTDQTGSDNIMLNPDAGAFSVSVGVTGLIQSIGAGYRAGSHLSNVALIDGQGQIGDIGSPMSLNLDRWTGARIQQCTTSDCGRTGRARINLAPAYPAELGVRTYTRDLEFLEDLVRVRDTILCKDAHQFEWHFQMSDNRQVAQEGADVYRICFSESAVRLRFTGPGLSAALAPTEVVWSYSNVNNDKAFKHLNIHTTEARNAICVEFEVSVG